jgi:hypothetical protein
MGISVAAVVALAALIFFALRADGMNAARQLVPVRVEVPPIDAKQPRHTETATFAEG